ncbi:MAG: inositol monophosphatase [Candidatus Riflebacteria bacterium]|nr:inositol monophosphatase [Candidatus Riflebacteria bacterium]
MFRHELQTAIQAALSAGEILMSRFRKIHDVTFKGPTDLVTEADLASEKLIREKLGQDFPNDSLFGEEIGGGDFHKGRTWVFDPLDGTTNFAHGLPIFSVSIAFCIDGIPKAGVIYLPVLNECFSCAESFGAYLNGTQINVSRRPKVNEALVVTGFPYEINSCIDEIIPSLKKMIIGSRGVRRLGSAAVDLCYVAAGFFDIFWEIKLKPWDVAAGSLLVKEAGGKVTDFSGGFHSIDRYQILATNGLLHEQAIEILRSNNTIT